MAYDYEELYRETPNALGDPSPAIMTFFKTYPKKRALVLDLGCGQGRDALAIARLEHKVVGVDFAPSGIADMCREAAQMGLELEGIVADIRDFTPDRSFDVIVFDRVLHMLARADRPAVLQRIIRHVAVEGHLLIADEKPNIREFQDLLMNDERNWSIALKNSTMFAQVASC